MNIQVLQKSYTEQDYSKYQERIREQLNVLSDLIRMPGFGGENYRFGGDVSVYLVDSDLDVSCDNLSILSQCGDPRINLGANKYQLRYQLSSIATSGAAFDAVAEELGELHQLTDDACRGRHLKVLPIGILPTLRRADITSNNMTDTSLQKALRGGLQRLRGESYRLQIGDAVPLEFTCNDITLEGANSAFNFHLKTPLKHFVNTWNALQLITPVVLGCASNSPFLFGQRLWDETRVALFMQAHKQQISPKQLWQKPARVNYGQGWLRNGPWELFCENVALFDPILPIVYPKDAYDSITAGELPTLDELQLHQSTVWTWNRALFDTAMNGSFHIESRCLPSGPSITDMIANIAFMAGLTIGLSDQVSALIAAFPFSYARDNFYRAAQYGLHAELLWPDTHSAHPRQYKVSQLASALLPIAEKGLNILGLETNQSRQYLDIIQRRIDKQITGAIWQSDTMTYYLKSYDHEQAQKCMLQDYMSQSYENKPVSDWATP